MLGTMNVGPVISKLQYIADMIDHLGLDVLIVPETHLTDTGTFRANLRKAETFKHKNV